MPTINLAGPDGNAFALIGMVKTWGRQLHTDTTEVIADMMSGDYQHLLDVMREWCEGNAIELDFEDPEDQDWG